MKQQFWPALGLASAVVVSGCQKAAPPEPAPAPAASAAAPAAPAQPPPSPQPAKPVSKGLEWDDPPQWKKLGAKGMRVASYEIPPAKGDKEAGELNVFILGGDIEPNIQRWLREFSGMPLTSVVRKDRTVNETRQAIVEVPKGKFNGGMGDKGERDNYGLLGGIVVAPSGAQYFFKLTAPANTIKAAREPFYALLDSTREAKPGESKPVGAGPAEGATVAPAAGKPASSSDKP